MNDLISRQAAIVALKEHRALYCDNAPDTFSKLSYAEKSRVDELDTAIAALVNLPPAEPKSGKWKNIVEGIEYDWGTCDTCGARIPMAYKYYEYCPHCGTKNEVEK